VTGAILKPEFSELFQRYRESESKLEVFSEEIVRWIRGEACTREELDAILRACVERGKELRAPTGRKRGRPRRMDRQAKPCSSAGMGTELSRFIASGSDDWKEFYRASERDRKEHGGFREICMVMGDFPANRPLFLEQVVLFIRGTDQRELGAIRRVITERRRTVRRPERGRPDVRNDEKIMARAREASWRRIVRMQSEEEIAGVLGMAIVAPVRGAGGRIEVPGNINSIKRQLQRLEDYLSAAIWNAISPNYVRVSGAGREIAPGALDHKDLQTYIGYCTGLPFRTHPEECKRIVQTLWPRGSAADWELLERAFRYRQKK
jgi:hypothetical protein